MPDTPVSHALIPHTPKLPYTKTPFSHSLKLRQNPILPYTQTPFTHKLPYTKTPFSHSLKLPYAKTPFSHSLKPPFAKTLFSHSPIHTQTPFSHSHPNSHTSVLYCVQFQCWSQTEEFLIQRRQFSPDSLYNLRALCNLLLVLCPCCRVLLNTSLGVVHTGSKPTSSSRYLFIIVVRNLQYRGREGGMLYIRELHMRKLACQLCDYATNLSKLMNIFRLSKNLQLEILQTLCSLLPTPSLPHSPTLH